MSDRINGYAVVLEHDVKDEDAEAIQAALQMVKGVLSVTPNVASLESHLAEARVRNELGTALWEVLYPKPS